MFKKSMLALALTGAAISGVANAGVLTIAGGKVDVSVEGNIKLGSSVLESDVDFGTTPATDDVTLNVGSDYIVNDIVVFTVAGATFDTTVNTIAATASAGTATFTLVDYPDANNVRFRVSTANHLEANDILLDKFKLKTTPVNKGKITIASNAISVNPLIGNYDASTAIELAEFATQVAYTVGKLDGEVSTGKGRAEFTNAGSTTKDILTLTAANNSAHVDAITYDKTVHVIKGDFSYLADYDADESGKLTGAELTAAMATTGFTSDVVTISDALDAVTITDTGAIATGTIQFNNKGQAAGGSIIASQSFTLDTTLSDTAPTAVSTVLAQTSAGSWTLDGSGADIAFLPFGSDYAQSITVTNSGSVVGAITVDLTAGGMTYTKELTAVSTAKAVTNISAEVAAFAAESGIVGDARVNVTVNAPGIVVKGLY